MSGTAASPGLPGTSDDLQAAREVARGVAGFWWLWLIVGIFWIIAALVILQFDQASVKTIGIIVGIMFVSAGIQQLALAAIADSMRWLWAIFGLLFIAAGIVCFANPEDTFAGLADILGFLFLMIGVWWTIRAFLEREVNQIWWLGLIAGLMMIVLAFWTGGQFFLDKAYTLLVFAGIWAMLQGVTDIVRAFQVRGLRDAL
ncbi:MAG: DUF308 domain-containing protein [Thermoleophilaceae bacterium]|nr:DUF308 domain-containing protein [Thermoleophilaceae bacterium]